MLNRLRNQFTTLQALCEGDVCVRPKSITHEIGNLDNNCLWNNEGLDSRTKQLYAFRMIPIPPRSGCVQRSCVNEQHASFSTFHVASRDGATNKFIAARSNVVGWFAFTNGKEAEVPRLLFGEIRGDGFPGEFRKRYTAAASLLA